MNKKSKTIAALAMLLSIPVLAETNFHTFTGEDGGVCTMITAQQNVTVCVAENNYALDTDPTATGKEITDLIKEFVSQQKAAIEATKSASSIYDYFGETNTGISDYTNVGVNAEIAPEIDPSPALEEPSPEIPSEAETEGMVLETENSFMPKAASFTTTNNSGFTTTNNSGFTTTNNSGFTTTNNSGFTTTNNSGFTTTNTSSAFYIPNIGTAFTCSSPSNCSGYYEFNTGGYFADYGSGVYFTIDPGQVFI